MADSEVLSASVRGRQHTHGHPTKHMGADELAYGLSLISTVVHSDVLKSASCEPSVGTWRIKHLVSGINGVLELVFRCLVHTMSWSVISILSWVCNSLRACWARLLPTADACWKLVWMASIRKTSNSSTRAAVEELAFKKKWLQWVRCTSNMKTD